MNWIKLGIVQISWAVIGNQKPIEPGPSNKLQLNQSMKNFLLKTIISTTKVALLPKLIVKTNTTTSITTKPILKTATTQTISKPLPNCWSSDYFN